jgi:hypothetical protein
MTSVEGNTVRRTISATLSALLVAGAAGCGGGLYPVSGKVTLNDGTPLTKGLVIFEGQEGDKKVTARGELQADGTYRLGTKRPGDGAPPGKYQVLISPQIDVDSPQDPPFDKRYTQFGTSGLTFEVTAGTNDFPIQLSRPGKGRR